MAQESYKWLRRRKIRAFYDYVAASRTSEGIRALIQTSGLGKLKPNIMMMGFHRTWANWSESAMDEYISAMNEALDANLAITLLWVVLTLSALHSEKTFCWTSVRSHVASICIVKFHIQMKNLQHPTCYQLLNQKCQNTEDQLLVWWNFGGFSSL